MTEFDSACYQLLPHLADRDLLRYVDRGDPVIAELAKRFEAARREIELLDPKAAQ